MSLSHLDKSGSAHMVDISSKAVTARSATAEAVLSFKPETLEQIIQGQLKKGDVFSAARISGIQASKKCADLIPLCHPLPLSSVEINFKEDRDSATLQILATCKTTAQTGVEMEALTAVSVAALTVYDMAKSVEKGIVIGPVRLLEKCGGKSGDYKA